MAKKSVLLLLMGLIMLNALALHAPKKNVLPLQPRVEPMFWWAGMKNPHLQLMVHAPEIGLCRVAIDYPGVVLKSVTSLPNPNYLFIDLDISVATPGSFDVQFRKDTKLYATYRYELKEREPGSAGRSGFSSSDVIYLVMPDRFANGDPSNDEIAGLKEKPDRNNPVGRHGGDIQGLRNHLDYLSGMGFTAVWLNPVLENDQPDYSYHGYATTDFYKVDARFGTNEEYREFAMEARRKGIKLIMDMIFNHCGSEHWWMKDMPMPDWINDYPSYQITNHVKTLNMDIHASEYDRKQLVNGWFVPVMPDLNQKNRFMATYLVQNSLWWIEYTGLSGIRMDTYPYPDKEMMALWNRRLTEEYPGFTVVGEEMHLNQAIISYWQKGKPNLDGYRGEVKSMMDFPLQHAVGAALREEGNGSLMKIYDCLANDFQYPDPQNLVVFPDNHDITRFLVQVKNDPDLFKMGIALFLTLRGIPQLYYGTEIMMSHTGTHDSEYRKDFPGGWANDSKNGFTGAGLSDQETEMQSYLKKLLHWRKDAEVMHSGKLIHFVPFDGVYVYFRKNEKDKVMVVLNKNGKETRLETVRLSEMLEGASRAMNVITGEHYNGWDNLILPPKSVSIFGIY